VGERSRGYRWCVPNHLEPVPPDRPGDAPSEVFDELELGFEEPEPIVRPAWWRWVAIAVIVAMAVAGPFAFALYELFS
jgi:hypothetical protein